MPREELLELLANRKGCFISSLRNPSDMDDTLKALQRIRVSEYGLKEWNDCLSYLAGKEISVQSEDEITSYLAKAVGADRSDL